jgi:hypothetical protein
MIEGRESAAWIIRPNITIPVGTTGTTYRLSGWIKSEGVAGKGSCLQALQFVEDRHITTTNSERSNAPAEWKKVTVEFTPKPHISSLQLRLLCDGVGRVWFDDVTLVKVR